MRLSAGNLLVVGLPAVTTKVCPLQGLFSYAKRNSVSSVGSVRDKKIKNNETKTITLPFGRCSSYTCLSRLA